MSTDKAPQILSAARLRALCLKESKQIFRDPGSLLIAVVIPLMLLFIFSYGVKMDFHNLRVGILLEEQSDESHRFVNTFTGSSYLEPTISTDRRQLNDELQRGNIRGIVVIPADFSQKMKRAGEHPVIQVITDGSEPNIANFVHSFVSGAWHVFLQQQAQDDGKKTIPSIELNSRYWFNANANSDDVIIPGALCIIITIVGTMLTSLVVAREWERGTMEALLATKATRTEIVLSKLIPYQILCNLIMGFCIAIAVFLLGLPFRGSFFMLFINTNIYITTSLGIGLLISALTRNQFNAAVIALNSAFLPAVMLSGFVFPINSMPNFMQWITYFIPARYYMSNLRTLFLAGDLESILLFNTVMLIITTIISVGITAFLTRKSLE